MLAAQGKPRQALAMFDRAQKQGYNLYSLPFQRGQAFRGARRLDEAYHQFTEAMLMTPPSPAYDILRLQLRTGRAADRPQRHRGLRPHGLPPIRCETRRGALPARARAPRARPAERGARVIDAGSETMKRGGPAHYARALAYHRLGRKAEAAREIDEAVRIGPANPMLLQWQARIRAMALGAMSHPPPRQVTFPPVPMRIRTSASIPPSPRHGRSRPRAAQRAGHDVRGARAPA
jgi:tetratricopeptide (TPR) repeat protein